MDEVRLAKLTVSVDENLIKPIKRLALEEDTSVSKIVTGLIRKYLAEKNGI
jgi:metal-responsive CopG/Arc/MetJ family transcriptional regulator